MGNVLFSTAAPAEMGYQDETFGFPAPDDELTDEVVYPELTGVGGGVSAYRSNTGEVFQGSAPEYAGRYQLDYMNAPGVLFDNSSYAPAPGSQDLIAPRYDGGVSGTNRLINSDGPVTGEGSDGGQSWTGERAELNRPNPNYGGPVVGGPDYSNSLGAAYYADTLAGYSEIAATSAMVSAV
jgi:hypothetical protein